MTAKNWWFKFDFRVWRTDSDLRRCSLETRGFWLEVLCIMHETGEPVLTGSYEELARLVGCESAEVARCVTELKRTNTADVTLGNGFVTLMSRRMKRELSDREQTRLRVQRHRGNADVTPMKQDRVRSKSKSNEKEEEKEREEHTHAQGIESSFLDTYFDIFPTSPLSIFLQETIADRITDPDVWRKTLLFWKQNNYRPQSVGKMCDKYDEFVTQGNGYGKANGRQKRTNTDALNEWAAFNATASTDRLPGEQKQIGTGVDDPWAN